MFTLDHENVASFITLKCCRFGAWRDDSAVKVHTHGDSQASVIPVLVDLMPSAGYWALHARDAYT